VGDRWWPVLGAVYVICAIKRVRGMRLVGLLREDRRARAAATAAVVAQRQRETAPLGRSGRAQGRP
jgi:hypothetical protein